MNTATRRFLIVASILGIGGAFALLGAGGEPDMPAPTPTPTPVPPSLPGVEPATPEMPPLVPGPTPADDQTGPTDEDNSGDTVPATPTFNPPSEPTPTPTPTPVPSQNTAGKWGPRHALLEELGYWSGPTNVPASAETVAAIEAFQEDAEAARNAVAGQSQSAAILSSTYGFISPDGQWGPEVANWAAWARDNYGLFYSAVQATTGSAPGA